MGLLTWLKTAPTAEAPAAPPSPADDPELPRYPPFLKGLPAAPPERLLATQTELVARLQDGLAFTDARFTTLVRPVIARYAAFVHLLPASEAHHHRGAGGLLRHGLEVAFHAARASQGRVFALDRSPGERRELEPRWRLAAGLAGLCHDLGKPVCDLSVCDQAGQNTWRPLLGSLSDWAAEQGVTHYYLRWRERRHRRHEPLALLVLPRVLTPEVSAWLADPDPEILSGLLAAAAGSEDASVLGALVREADQASVAHDLRENHLDPTASALGVPVDRYLVDAMRRLVRGGRWTINVPGARLWLLPEGLHVVWPAAAEELVALLAADRVPGIPRDPDTLAEILIERGLAVPPSGANPTDRYWHLAPAPLARDGRAVTLTLLRLASPELVLSGARPPTVEVVAPTSPGAEVAGAEHTAVVTEASPTAVEAMRQPVDVAPMAPSTPADGADRAACRDHASPTGVERPSEATVTRESPEGEEAARARGVAAWLRARGAGGEVLLQLAQALAANPPEGSHVRAVPVGDQLLVRFPEGLAGLGAPPQVQLDALAAAGLLETDPLAPLRRVREIGGDRGVLLTGEATRSVLILSRPVDPPRAPSLPETTRSRDAVSARAALPAAGNPPAKDDAASAARALVALIRSRDAAIPGGVRQTPDGLAVGADVPTWFITRRPGVNRYALLRALGRIEGCRVGPDGGLTLRQIP